MVLQLGGRGAASGYRRIFRTSVLFVVVIRHRPQHTYVKRGPSSAALVPLLAAGRGKHHVRIPK